MGHVGILDGHVRKPGVLHAPHIVHDHAVQGRFHGLLGGEGALVVAVVPVAVDFRLVGDLVAGDIHRLALGAGGAILQHLHVHFGGAARHRGGLAGGDGGLD